MLACRARDGRSTAEAFAGRQARAATTGRLAAGRAEMGVAVGGLVMKARCEV
jgi:hypothetical protein